ncbi:UNVERIFIED_CONTAM: hypothetical protein Slati_1039100 [Sesamum latifolium]|uniref:Uncharacterized protein n=1 Tax=Sesamum latifolium TaxID=2727402 RepID=A0AAW2XSU2_9LAMI
MAPLDESVRFVGGMPTGDDPSEANFRKADPSSSVYGGTKGGTRGKLPRLQAVCWISLTRRRQRGRKE